MMESKVQARAGRGGGGGGESLGYESQDKTKPMRGEATFTLSVSIGECVDHESTSHLVLAIRFIKHSVPTVTAYSLHSHSAYTAFNRLLFDRWPMVSFPPCQLVKKQRNREEEEKQIQNSFRPHV